MVASFPVFFSAPHSLMLALFLLIAGSVIVAVRRPRIGRGSILLFGLGGLLIALAAGEPHWDRRSAGSVDVMVDLSPSTRGALFRDRAALDIRIHQLLGDHPYRLLAFADSVQPLPSGSNLVDLPVDRTVFTPTPADAILLFSDGRFELPATGPPTYPVIDPTLNQPGDAAVTRLDSFNPYIIASVRNDGGPRQLSWAHAKPLAPSAVVAGSYQAYATPDVTGEISATLPRADRWPENDSLSILPTPDSQTERWWVGNSAPPGWRRFDPAGLSTEASDYLRTSAIVLQNIPADSLSTAQRVRLAQYVRDLGGSLTIVGGDHTFAAGYYQGTPLDSLSPLASSPPEPTMHWMLLVDGSGSMAGEGGAGPTPWQIESAAVAALLPRLPPEDSVSVGSFAESLSWWTTGKSATETALLHLPPASVFPHGPTNLAPALEQIISATDGSAIEQLLVMTDADTELPNPDELIDGMVRKKIHLHVLATGHGGALPALTAMAAATGGSVVEQIDPREWVAAGQILLKRALPTRYQHEPITIHFDLPAIGSQSVDQWNQAWLRKEATQLADGKGNCFAATWQQGAGRVTAIAFPADNSITEALSKQIETRPHDPRFTVDWENGPELKVTVNAVAGKDSLNNQSIRLELCDAQGPGGAVETQTIPQTGPGYYERHMPAARRPRIATVLVGPEVVERFAIAGRYAPEFDAIGNDLTALNELAHRTGGNVILPGSNRRIDFQWPLKSRTIASELAFIGFLCVATALVLNRRFSSGH